MFHVFSPSCRNWSLLVLNTTQLVWCSGTTVWLSVVNSNGKINWTNSISTKMLVAQSFFLHRIVNYHLERTSRRVMESFSTTHGKQSSSCSQKSMLANVIEMSLSVSMSLAEDVLVAADSTLVKSVQSSFTSAHLTVILFRSGYGCWPSVRTEHGTLRSGMALRNTETGRISCQWSKASLFFANATQLCSKTNPFRFWNSLEPYTSERALQLKSFSTYFSDGFGDQFFLHGLVSKTDESSRFWSGGYLEYCPASLVSSRSTIVPTEQCQWKSMVDQSRWRLFWWFMPGDSKRHKRFSSVSSVLQMNENGSFTIVNASIVFSSVWSRSNHVSRLLLFSKQMWT